MKRFIALSLVIVMILAMALSMASCGAKEPSPTEVLDSFLKEIQADGMDDPDLELGDIEDESEGAEYLKVINEKMKEFEYELSNEQINGDEATVDLKIKTYGFGALIGEVLDEYIEQAITMSFSGASEEEMTALFEDLFIEKAKTLEKNYEETITVEMIKGEDGWEVADKTEENPMLDALLGGLYSSLKSLDDLFSSGK